MSIFHVIILAIIEGITEFLPISSTGHLILASKLLHIPASNFVKSFEIFIQLGAIMAVVSLYLNRVIKNSKLIKNICIAFLPTGIFGLLLYKVVKTYLLSNDIVVVITLASIGAILILLEWFFRKHPPKESTSIQNSPAPKLLSIGVFQSLSMIPGVSRSGATIVGGMLTGLSRKEAIEFSFLLAVPTMVAATGLDLLQSSSSFSINEYGLLALGFVIAWITAVIVVKAFITYVSQVSFTGFGIYRIVIALLYWVFVIV